MVSQEPVPLEEFTATVDRMERRLCAVEGDLLVLWEAYRRLVPRFEAELAASQRDIALAKSRALMVIQEVIKLRVPPAE